mmetsp:Transcript_29633/g.77607  ORF Transcript_29633/g.77607 Transcript_29633/m.77607 type:complete len:236 (-) Transcript_29633:486-1193(-)
MTHELVLAAVKGIGVPRVDHQVLRADPPVAVVQLHVGEFAILQLNLLAELPQRRIFSKEGPLEASGPDTHLLASVQHLLQALVLNTGRRHLDEELRGVGCEGRAHNREEECDPQAHDPAARRARLIRAAEGGEARRRQVDGLPHRKRRPVIPLDYGHDEARGEHRHQNAGPQVRLEGLDGSGQTARKLGERRVERRVAQRLSPQYELYVLVVDGHEWNFQIRGFLGKPPVADAHI